MKRLIATVAAALCIVSAFAQNAQNAQSAQNAPKDWAKFGRYSDSNSQIAGRQINAVFMGNSITDNWSNKLDPDFFTEHNFVGRGISGQTTSEMLVRFRRDVIDLSPKAVVILAGTNDIAMNNGYISLENAMGNIISMCELAKAAKIKVILCSVLPCDRYSWRPEVAPAEKIQQLNVMIRKYAEDNKILYIDWWTAMNNGQGGLDESISKDGCHPNLDGYKIMESVFLEKTKKFKW